MNTAGPRKAAIWARVSTTDQKTDNQVYQLREWAQNRGLDVVAEFVTEDSAWASNGARSNGKGAEFDRQRADLLEGARMGRYRVVLCWGLDRLSRRGAEDMLTFVRMLTETGCELWSQKDPWVENTRDPFARELMLGIFGTLARFESERRSARIRDGLARRKREGKKVGGRKKGQRDRRPRAAPTGEAAGWTPERRAAQAERNRERWAAQRGEGQEAARAQRLQAVLDAIAGEGLSAGDVAARLGVARTTALTHLHRLRDEGRAEMSGTGTSPHTRWRAVATLEKE